MATVMMFNKSIRSPSIWGLVLLAGACTGSAGTGASTAGSESDTSTADVTSTTGSTTSTTGGATGSGTGASSGATGSTAGSTGPGPKVDLGPEGCDPAKQNCPDPGDKCTGYTTRPGACCIDANHCVPDTGDKGVGEPCTREDGTDDCTKGAICLTNPSGELGPGVCVAYCDLADPDACSDHEGGECSAFNDGALPRCEYHCNPLNPDCPQAMECLNIWQDGVGGICGSVPSTVPEGGVCWSMYCEEGLACDAAQYLDGCDNEYCCTPYCNLNAGTVDNPACTNPLEGCYAARSVDYPDLGTCRLNP